MVLATGYFLANGACRTQQCSNPDEISTKGDMHLNKSNLTSTVVYRAARQPQMLNYHIIVQLDTFIKQFTVCVLCDRMFFNITLAIAIL